MVNIAGAEVFGANDEGDPVADEQALDTGEEVAGDSGFGDLELLLAESVKQRDEGRAARVAKERLRRGGQNAREQAEDKARLAAWKAAYEWVPRANVAYFERTVCKCGAKHQIFVSLMQRREHRYLRSTMQWQLVQEAVASLPNETVRRTRKTVMCGECASYKGWPMHNITEWDYR